MCSMAFSTSSSAIDFQHSTDYSWNSLAGPLSIQRAAKSCVWLDPTSLINMHQELMVLFMSEDDCSAKACTSQDAGLRKQIVLLCRPTCSNLCSYIGKWCWDACATGHNCQQSAHADVCCCKLFKVTDQAEAASRHSVCVAHHC